MTVPESLRAGLRAAAAAIGYVACLALAFAAALFFITSTRDGGRAVDAGTVVTAVPEVTPAPTAPPVVAAAPEAPPPPSPQPPSYALGLDRADVAYGSREVMRVQVLGPDGAPVLAAGADVHLAVVRADLHTYQDLQPEPDGPDAWRVPLTLPEPGPYQMLCEIRLPGSHAPVDLSAAIVAAGDYLPVALDPPSSWAATRRYVISMAGEPAPGEETELTFTVTEDGVPLTDLLPLDGQTVGLLHALRAHDMARGRVTARTTAPPGGAGGPDMRFGVLFPAAGTYRLFLDFQRAGGRRHTVAFTVAVPE